MPGKNAIGVVIYYCLLTCYSQMDISVKASVTGLGDF